MKHPQFRTRDAAEHYRIEHDVPDVVVREIWSTPSDWDADDSKVIGYALLPRPADRAIAPPSSVAQFEPQPLRTDLMTHVYPAYRYAWGKYYPLRASSALIAEGKVGKSTLSLAQQLHGAAGKDYLGAPTTEGLYIYLSCEDDIEIVERRAQRIMQTFTPAERAKAQANFKIIDGVGKGIRFVLTVQKMTGIDPTVDKLIAAVRRVADGRDVIHLTVDTVSRINGGEENATEVMSAVEQALSRIAQALGCAVTALHHTSKAVAREGIADAHAGRGAASFGDNCRSVLRLMPLTWAMVTREKLEGLDRTAVERGDVLKLIHAALNQDRKADPIYLKRTDTGLLEKIEPTVRTEAQAADVEFDSLVAWFVKQGNAPFSVKQVSDSHLAEWSKMTRGQAKAFITDAIYSGKLTDSGERRKGGVLYVPAVLPLATPDPFGP
jgi:hypothetical protein